MSFLNNNNLSTLFTPYRFFVFVAVATTLIFVPGAHSVALASSCSTAYNGFTLNSSQSPYASYIGTVYTPSVQKTVNQVSLFMGKTDNGFGYPYPTQNLQLSIYEATSTSVGTKILTSSVVLASSIPIISNNSGMSGGATTTFIFSNTVLYPTSHYYFVVEPIGSQSAPHGSYQICPVIDSGSSVYHLDSSYISTLVQSSRSLFFSGDVLQDSSHGFGSSRIISFTPAHNSVYSSTTPTITFEANVYIDPDDLGYIKGVTFDIYNQSLGTGLLNVPSETFRFTSDMLVSGNYTYSTTTVMLPVGGYTLRVHLDTNYWGVTNPLSTVWNTNFESSDSSNPRSQYHHWVVDRMTLVQQARANAGDTYSTIFNSTTSSTTISAQDCNVLSGFDPVGCLLFMFVPSGEQMSEFLGNTRDLVITAFPFGYVTRLYSIVVGSVATSSLPTLSATIPAGYPGAGSTLNLSPWGKLMGPGSYLATATSTVTGQTFYSTFSYYWKFFVYFSFGLMVCLEIISLNGVGSVDVDSDRRWASRLNKERLHSAHMLANKKIK